MIMLPENPAVLRLKNITLVAASALALALALAACGDKADGAKPAASQVAAKVNSGEISVHQLNFVLQRMPGLRPEQAAAARKQVLESLIDQELAVQQAVEAKLDRSPEVLQALEAARREVLARAYLERQMGSKEKPSAEEVKKYFDTHPELFSARKIYRLEETGFSATAANLAAAREIIAAGKTGGELVAALKARGIETTSGTAVKPAEQIALEILPRLAQQKEGQPQLFENGDKAAIITVVAAKSDPVPEAKATAAIEQFLAGRQRSDQAREKMKELRQKAKIDYLGEFASGAQAAAPAAAIDKGIAGLK